MIVVRPQDVKHKAWLMRLLTAIADDQKLNKAVAFKGGTCAAMQGILDRFSVDLDFDLRPGSSKDALRPAFHEVFSALGLTVKDQSQRALVFLLRYPGEKGERSTIKIDVVDPPPVANKYAAIYLPEIERTMMCQTRETMFANKLVAPLDRFTKHSTVAGRDIYDIHHFFYLGLAYDAAVIRERTGWDLPKFFQKLSGFIEKHISSRAIDEDLSTLLTPEAFQKVRKTLLRETIDMLLMEKERTS